MSPHSAPARHDDAARRLAEACDAVRAERRANSRALLLTCKAVAPTSSGDATRTATHTNAPTDTRGETTVHALAVTRFARLDWTWEGARAFAHRDDQDPDAPQASARPPAWAGEVVEVDPVHNRVFVATERGAPAPTQGAFVIQPFDYLEALDTIYTSALGSLTESPLAVRLQRTADRTAVETCPVPRGATTPGGPLTGVWDHPLGAVWGPPGTGKTYTLGEQVAEALRDPDERILVVSTTNKATDQAALAIADALRRHGGEVTPEVLRRVGAAVDARRLEDAGLAHLIDQGPRELRDEIADTIATHRAATDPDERALLWNDLQQLRAGLRGGQRLDQVPARVVVATAFAATLAAASRAMLERLTLAGSAPFRTVLIDEAGLVSRAGTAALALWADRRAVLYGDPHQLSNRRAGCRPSRPLPPPRSARPGTGTSRRSRRCSPPGKARPPRPSKRRCGRRRPGTSGQPRSPACGRARRTRSRSTSRVCRPAS